MIDEKFNLREASLTFFLALELLFVIHDTKHVILQLN